MINHILTGTKPPEIPAEYYPTIINEITDYAIFIMDVNGTILSWNEGCILIKQYKAEEVIGKFYGFLFPEDMQKRKDPKTQLEKTRKEGRLEAEGWRKKKDGSMFWALVVLTAIYNKEGEIVGFIKITKDLTEKKKAEEVLKKSNEKLQKINEELDNFVYTASHDLKAPIANIEGLILSIDQNMPKEDFEQHIHFIQNSVERFKSTIHDLTEISKAHQEWGQYNEELVSLEELLENIWANLSPTMKEACSSLEKDLQVTTLVFSKANLRSLLHNLLTNAIKYRSNERACNIKIASKLEGDYVLLSIEDNGIGMQPGYEDKLFRMFRRMHDHVEGSGVGLYLVKRIVDNAGGKVKVESTAGKGSTFTIYLKNKPLHS